MARTASGRILVFCSVALAIAGCEVDDAERPPQITVTDSAGQLHVRLGRLAEITTPRWQTEELYKTREELFRVTAARFLGDGSLAVANSGTQEILFFDPSGGLRARVGGAGEGPGEFGHISTLRVDPAGDLVAYDPRVGRMTVIDTAGNVLGTRRLAPPSRVVDLFPLALLSDQRVLAVFGDSRVFAPDGERRDSTPLLVFDSAGDVSDTLGVWPAQEWSYASLPQGSTRMEVGFGRTLAYAGRSGYSVLGITDSVNLTVFDREGRAVMSVVGGGPNAPVGAAEIERWRADQLERRSNAPEFIKRAVSEAPYHETHPAFSALLVDEARRVWIGAYSRPGETQRQWVVIGPDGQLRGTVALPADAQVLDGADEKLAMLQRNDLDEEQIVVLRIARSP